MTSDSFSGHARTIDHESSALIIAAIAFIASATIAFFVFAGRELAIDGPRSLGEATGISSAVAAALAFAAARIRSSRATGEDLAVRFRWFDVVALSLAHAAIALLGWIGIATIMEHSFIGATVFATPAVLITASATALSAYISYLSGTSPSPRQLSLVLAMFLVVGMVTAMLSSSDPAWWQKNLSALGMTHDISSLTFNLTLIVSGIIITTIARLGTAGLPATTAGERRRRNVVRTLFVLLGVFLACVGVFPVDQFFVLHNTVATGMAVVFAVLVLGLPWLTPSMSKVFIVLGYVDAALIAALAVLFFVGIYNLTAVELISALLIFSWIILFLRNVQAEPHASTARPLSGVGRPVEHHAVGAL